MVLGKRWLFHEIDDARQRLADVPSRPRSRLMNVCSGGFWESTALLLWRRLYDL